MKNKGKGGAQGIVIGNSTNIWVAPESENAEPEHSKGAFRKTRTRRRVKRGEEKARTHLRCGDKRTPGLRETWEMKRERE